MAKSISVDDETYNLIADFAKRDDRPMSNALARLVKLGLGISRPPEIKKVETPNGVGSQANKRLVATGNEHMPVRESLPDDLEEAVQTATDAKNKMKPENAKAVCDKRCVDEGWSDEQYKYEYDNYIAEQKERYDAAIVVLQEHNINIGI